jgi:hypothetical protein
LAEGVKLLSAVAATAPAGATSSADGPSPASPLALRAEVIPKNSDSLAAWPGRLGGAAIRRDAPHSSRLDRLMEAQNAPISRTFAGLTARKA